MYCTFLGQVPTFKTMKAMRVAMERAPRARRSGLAGPLPPIRGVVVDVELPMCCMMCFGPRSQLENSLLTGGGGHSGSLGWAGQAHAFLNILGGLLCQAITTHQALWVPLSLVLLVNPPVPSIIPISQMEKEALADFAQCHATELKLRKECCLSQSHILCTMPLPTCVSGGNSKEGWRGTSRVLLKVCVTRQAAC